MANPKHATEGMDLVKIYLIAMAGLVFVTIVWLLYNYITLAYVEKQLALGIRDLQTIFESEAALPAKPAFTGDLAIENVFEFFKRTVRGLPEIPEVSDPPIQNENVKGILLEEKHYIIRFEKINRKDLTRYIYKIQEAKPFLKVKNMEVNKPEGTTHEDFWKAEITFAFRRPKIGEGGT